MAEDRTYIAIDLKSFYASVECTARGLDPLKTNLVVADESRTEKTICLAVSPSLKAFGIPGRARLFEVVQRVREVNAGRLRRAPGHSFTGESFMAPELEADPGLKLTYIAARPRMSLYMEVSTQIYKIYLRHVAPEDIHVYSIDEVFIDATDYMRTLKMTARDFTMMLIREVLAETGITATAGIGTNLYLCKIAMDIEAKHIPADRDGVRIAELDEMSYRRKLWDHRPLTDFWRIGRGIASRLEAEGMRTMGDVARKSLENEDRLYRLFGVNAELLIDHAWGWEPCGMKEIKSYRPASSSLSSGQVLKRPYSFDEGRLIVREMTEVMALELLEKRLVTDQLVLDIGYDVENMKHPERLRQFDGEIKEDRYGRSAPKMAHGTRRPGRRTSSARLLTEAADALYCEIVNSALTIRRVYVSVNNLMPESEAEEEFTQLDLFGDSDSAGQAEKEENASLEKERRRQEAVLDIRRKYGKNAMLKGMNLKKAATAVERNGQVGGHKA